MNHFQIYSFVIIGLGLIATLLLSEKMKASPIAGAFIACAIAHAARAFADGAGAIPSDVIFAIFYAGAGAYISVRQSSARLWRVHVGVARLTMLAIAATYGALMGFGFHFSPMANGLVALLVAVCLVAGQMPKSFAPMQSMKARR